MMQSLWRRYQGRNTVLTKIKEYIAARHVQSRWRSYKTFKVVRSMVGRRDAAHTIQRCWRRFYTCRFARTVYLETRNKKQRHRGSIDIQRVFRGYYYGRRVQRRLRIQKQGPQTPTEWEAFVQAAKDDRITDPRFKNASFVQTVGIYEQYSLLAHPDIVFYKNTMTGVYSWDEPDVWAKRERREAREFVEQATTGFTSAERKAAIVLQTHFRGRGARLRFRAVAKGLQLMQSAEDKYLRDPHNIVNMCNYMLFLLCFKHAYDRVRPIAQRCINEMETRGPDNAFILYTYAIFLTAAAEEDWVVIRSLVARARLADKKSTAYNAAFEGFFRQARASQRSDPTALFHFGIASMLVKRDYGAAEESFLMALENMSMQTNLHERIISTFDFMISELQGKGAETSAAEKWRVHAERRAIEHWESEKRKMDQKVLVAGISRLQAVYRRIKTESMFDEYNLRYSRVVAADGTIRWRDEDTGELLDQRPHILAQTATMTTKKSGFSSAPDDSHQSDEKLSSGDWDTDTAPEHQKADTDTASPHWGDTDEALIENGASTPAKDPHENTAQGADEGEHWEEHMDDDQNVFYYNTVTGVSRWDKPLSLVRKFAKALGSLHAHSEQPVDDVDDEWEEHVDAESETPYYYNKYTGESRWDRPLKLAKKIAMMARFAHSTHSEEAENEANDDVEWEEVIDTETDTPYYYNPLTGESRWDKPLERVRRAARVAATLRSLSTGSKADVEDPQESPDPEHSQQDSEPLEELVAPSENDLEVWEEVIDPDSNSSYWYNPNTGESRWDNPKDPEGAATTSESVNDEEAWQEHHDDDGYAYYFNANTGESSWTNPLKKLKAALKFGFLAYDGASTTTEDTATNPLQSDATTQRAEALPENWEAVTDTDGYVYYYNSVTGVSQYEVPGA